MRVPGCFVVAIVASALAAGLGCARVQTSNGTGSDGGPGSGVDALHLSDAIFLTCGNGVKDPTESCDDGNPSNGDGCNRLCQIEADYACPEFGRLCVSTARCGDGKLSSSEACDDNNAQSGDGCSGTCTIEPGWQCRAPGKRCVPLCGDSLLTGSETCDDGNAISGDGCSSTCLIEPGASCTKPGTGRPSACIRAVCGNGMIETGESCDNGSSNGLFYGDGAGCSKTCTKEPSCRDGSGHNRACATTCGNGNIEAGEQCDDGNLISGDGCSATCTNEAAAGFTCTPVQKPDTVPCTQLDPMTGLPNQGMCLELPITYRDFKDEHQPGGHPDFPYYGTTVNGAVTRSCIPNSSGPAHGGDATARCWDIALPDLVNGKPQLNPAATMPAFCACRFTDFSTAGNNAPGYTEAIDGPLRTLEFTAPASVTYANNGHPQWTGRVPSVTSAASFDQWFNDSPGSSPPMTHTTGTLELAPIAGGQLRYSSDPNSITGGFFPLDKPPAPTGAGITVPGGEPLLCNLWPYWARPVTFPGCMGPQYLFPPSIPAAVLAGPMCATRLPAGCVVGALVPVTQGEYHNSWFTDEVHYYFTFPATGGISLQFYGDDDMFIFINGKLVVDLGSVHQRLPGQVTVDGTGTATIIEGGFLDAAGNITPCPSGDPADPLNTLGRPLPLALADCRSRTLPLGLVPGSTYEIAIFGADRHPTESNYQLTLNGFTTTETVCVPVCGDGVVSGGEECDEGAMNNDSAYGGCTTKCKFGPFCGDAIMNGPETCDAGKNNTATYGVTGCTPGCTAPRYCGDAMSDFSAGEQCDLGAGSNGSPGALCSIACTIIVP